MTTTTEAATTQVYRVYIKATPQKIWDAITTPEWTEKYGYGGRVEYELRPGGRFVGYTSAAMRAHGAPEVAIDGEVIESEPPHRLVLSWRMPMDAALAAEGFTRLSYELKEMKGGVTRLTLVHDVSGAPKLALLLAGGLEEMGAGGGWSWVLSDLKTLLETGSYMDANDPMKH